MPRHFHISDSIDKTTKVQILQKLNLLVNREYLQDQLLEVKDYEELNI